MHLDLESHSDISLLDHHNKSHIYNLEVVNPDLDTEAGGNSDLVRTETDVVHPRLSSRGRLLDIHVETGKILEHGM